jgi:hypothetical protein
MPQGEINGLEAHIKSLFGSYSTTDMMLDGDLPTRVVQQKLTPKLAAVVPAMKDELNYALDVEVPECQGKNARLALGNSSADHDELQINGFQFKSLICCVESSREFQLEYFSALISVAARNGSKPVCAIPRTCIC